MGEGPMGRMGGRAKISARRGRTTQTTGTRAGFEPCRGSCHLAGSIVLKTRLCASTLQAHAWLKSGA